MTNKEMYRESFHPTILPRWPETPLMLRNTSSNCATYRVEFSRDDQLLACGPEFGAIRLWDRRRGPLSSLATFFEDEKLVDVSFSDDGSFLVVGRKYSLETWNIIPVDDLSDTQVREKIRFQLGLSMRLSGYSLTATAISPDSEFIATGHDVNSQIHLRKAGTGQPVRSMWPENLRGRDLRWLEYFSCTSLAFTKDGKELLSGHSDRRIRVWDLEEHANLNSVVIPRWIPPDACWNGRHDSPVTCLAMSTAECRAVPYLYSTGTNSYPSFDGRVNVWWAAYDNDENDNSDNSVVSADGGTHRRYIPNGAIRHVGGICSMAISSYHRHSEVLAISCGDGKINLFDTFANHKLCDTLVGTGWLDDNQRETTSPLISSLAFSSDQSALAAASQNGTLTIWYITSKAASKYHSRA